MLIALLAGVGAVVWLNRPVPPERVEGRTARTALEEPVVDLAGAIELAERVRAEMAGEFSVRTVVVDLGAASEGPPLKFYLLHRTPDNTRDFTLQIDNDRQEMVVTRPYPTPPAMRRLPPPEPVVLAQVGTRIEDVVHTADGVVRFRLGSEDLTGWVRDAALTTRQGLPLWSVSYTLESDVEGDAPQVETVVIDARTGLVHEDGG